MQLMARSPRLAKGGTLIEVLISILLVSFGLLGMVGLQGASLIHQRLASIQVVGSQLALGLGDLARANPSGFRQDSYSWTQNYLSGQAPAGPDCGIDTTCTAAEAGAAELRAWLANVRGALPQGDAFVQRSTDGGALDIWLMWKNAKSVESPGTATTCASAAIGHLAPNDRPHCIFFRVRA